MVYLLYHLIGLLFFDVTLWYYIIIILIWDHRWFSSFNLRSLIVLCLSSGGINLSLTICSSFASEWFFGEVFETFVILPAILSPIKSPVTSAVFWNALFEEVLSESVADCLALSRSF